MRPVVKHRQGGYNKARDKTISVSPGTELEGLGWRAGKEVITRTVAKCSQ